jgi:hypothetical protein
MGNVAMSQCLNEFAIGNWQSAMNERAAEVSGP